MNNDPVTLTLPFLTWQGLTVLLVALGVFIAVGLVWVMLTGAEREKPPALESWFTALAWVLLPVWVLLLAATLWGMWEVFNGIKGAALADTSFGLGALIAAFLGAPFVIYGTWLRHKTNRLEQEGHMTDRINKAVEQLGAEKTVKFEARFIEFKRASGGDNLYETRINKGQKPDLPDDVTWHEAKPWQTVDETVPNIEVRIGAILSLERIAQDSTANDNGRDHVRVMEILCAYIRENAPANNAPKFEFPHKPTDDRIDKKLKSRPYTLLDALERPRIDVQLALSVIGRRSQPQIDVERAYRDGREKPFFLDLSNCCLRKADLEGLNFSNTSFFRSLMQGAFCKEANFADCNFRYAQLTGISAEKANFSGAKIEICDFSYANCANADFTYCHISFTDFVCTNIQGATFYFHDNYANTKINRSFFINVHAKGALFQGDLIGLNFYFRKHESEIYPSNSFGVGFRDARLGAHYAIIGEPRPQMAYSREWLGAAFGDRSVKLPEGMPRPGHWPDWKLPDTGEHAFDTEWLKWRANPDTY
ncbi:MAG: hypothetical protein EA407_05585, partial [Rhodobacteraceae bacterium]